MKKILLFFVLMLVATPAFAKNIKVEALDNFSTSNPPKIWKVKILESFVADNGISIHKNTIVEGDIINVKSPKRLKRNATFCFVPKYYYDPIEGTKKNIKRDFEGKYSATNGITAKNVAKKGAVTAGNILIGSFVAPAVGLVEGGVKNERGNRAKSAAISAYESTPLSYANKGKELEFQRGQVFIMSFKLKNENEEIEDEPNYSYEIINK